MTQTRRPPSVTMACVFIGLTSLIVFGSLASELSNWGSIGLQDAVKDALDDPALKDFNLTVPEVIEWLRRAAYGVIFLSIAGVVFAVFTALGHRGSRVLLTVMCGLTFIGFVGTGGLAGLLPAALAMVCAMRLWSPESRAWFDAKNGITRHTAPADPLAVAPAIPAAPGVVSQPAPPKPVRVAGLVALIASWLVVMFSSYYVLVYMIERESYVESLGKEPMKGMLADYNLEPADAARLLFIALTVLGILALAGCAAALLMLTGKPYARTAIIVLAAVTVPLSFMIFIVGWPWTAAAIFVLVTLRSPGARIASP